MSYLKIEEKQITNLKTFEWGEKWRALTISKEQRMDKDYYFAYLVRFYGKQDNTFEYDIGNSSEEFAWIGRRERYVGRMGPDKDPESKTFGQRIEFPPKTEEIETIDAKGRDVKKRVLIKGRVVYDFILPVNKESTEKIKTLIGPITVNKQTVFQVVAGNEPPVSVTQEVFFDNTVGEIMTHHLKLQSLVKTKSEKK